MRYKFKIKQMYNNFKNMFNILFVAAIEIKKIKIKNKENLFKK